MTSGGDQKPPRKHRGEGWQAFMMVSQLGINMGVCIVGGFMLGLLLDRVLGTTPWMLILLTILGVGASFKVMYDYGTK